MKYSDIYFCVSSGNRRLIDEGWRMFLVAAIGCWDIRGMGATEISDHCPPRPPGNIVDTIGSDPDTFTDLIQEMCNYPSIQTSYIDTNHLAPWVVKKSTAVVSEFHTHAMRVLISMNINQWSVPVKHVILAFLVLSRKFIYNLDISTQIRKCRLCFWSCSPCGNSAGRVPLHLLKT